jgi:hypothetical protein
MTASVQTISASGPLLDLRSNIDLVLESAAGARVREDPASIGSHSGMGMIRT